jgi:hypothetical protein
MLNKVGRYCVKKIFILLCGLTLLLAGGAAAETQSLEKVARAYAVSQPGLQSYRTTIVSDNISRQMDRIMASLPADAPRPPQPEVVKYWSRATETSLVRAEGATVSPSVQEIVRKFSRDLTLELRSILLPAAKAGERARLLEKSRVKRSVNWIGEVRLETLVIDFAEPVDLNGAFYGPGLERPQRQIKQLVVDLDLDQEIVKRIEVTTAGGDTRLVEVRHYDIKGGLIPSEILVTSPDGSIDENFKIRVDLIDSFWLPVRMYHTLRKGDVIEDLYVKFLDYEVNLELPGAVRKHLQP